MALLVLFVGKTKEGYISQGIEKYARLAGRHVKVEVRELKGSSKTEPRAAVSEEGDAILERLAPEDFLVALDERGKLFDSAAFAGELGRLLESGRRVVFAAGGPFGISEGVKARAGLVLSLSRLTFTHEMARLVLLEQIYRAITINKGMTYHY